MSHPTRIDIANIAAGLLSQSPAFSLEGDMGAATGKAVAACRMAVLLLDIAEFAEGAIKSSGAITEAGIDLWEERQVAIAQRHILERRTPTFEYPEGEPIPWREFEKHLHPNKPSADRLPRFKRWLASMEGIDDLTAADRLAEMKRDGVPRHISSYYFMTYFTWWKQALSDQTSTNGKQGQAVKQKKARATKGGKKN